MTYTIKCQSEFGVLQAKANAAALGYRYVAIGRTVLYWR